MWLGAAAGIVRLGAEIYPGEKDQSSCGELMDMGENLSFPFDLPIRGQRSSWKPLMATRH